MSCRWPECADTDECQYANEEGCPRVGWPIQDAILDGPDREEQR